MNSTPVRPNQVLFPLGLGTALSLMGDATLGCLPSAYTVLPTHTADAGITLGSVGIILSANADTKHPRAVRLLLNGPSGLAYDRWPRRWLFLPALFVGDLSSHAQRGRAIGLLHTAGDFGSAAGPAVAYALLPWTGLSGVYLLCAAFGFLSAFTASLILTRRLHDGK